MIEEIKVTCTISTKNRYFTTLPLCLTAIAMQTRPPDELIIFDDGDRKDLQQEPLYQNIFCLLNSRHIAWKVIFGSGEGQVKNHQAVILGKDNDGSDLVKSSLIWRLDDDNVPETNVLETLIESMTEKTGAVAGLVLDPKASHEFDPLASNKIEDIFLGINEQWCRWPSKEIKKVDHLYSSFLFRKEAAKHGYEMNLSRVGHREETIFSYEMTRNGWDCLINPNAITWHFHNPTGGIRDNTTIDMWKHDDAVFSHYIVKWGITPTKYKHIILDNGIGDHFCFKTILPKIQKKYNDHKLILAVCFPDVFWDMPDLCLISIARAKEMHVNIDEWQIYKWMIDNRWTSSLVSAFEKMYQV